MAIRMANRVLKPIHTLPLLPANVRGRSNSPKDNYQYIHKSKIPTLRFQESLPRLPIPKLENTANRYLTALKPILCSNDYVCSETVVREFVSVSGAGQSLQNQLKEVDKECPHSNYLCQFWLDMYLCNRRALPINSNPVILLEKDPVPELNKQDIRSANLLLSSLRFMKSFRDRVLKPEVLHSDPNKVDKFLFRAVTGLLPSSKTTEGAHLFKAFPVDMSQFRCLFNFSRIPQTCMDRLYQDERHKHVVVIRRGHFFVFDVLDNNGDILDAGEVLACLRHIISLADCTLGDACHSLASLTTMDRDTWASVRKCIREYSQINADSLQKIDSAILVLALDTECPTELNCRLHSLLCGNGVNRWFDKSINLIIDGNGGAGINYEQSSGDGVAIMRYINEIYKDSTKRPQVSEATTTRGDPVAKVKRLEFCLDDSIKKTIHNAQCSYQNIMKEVEVNTFTCHGLGKKDCRNNKLSSDAMFQLGIQLAYHRLKGHSVAAYEPCSTALFKYGRTEVIRPCTMETKELCESLNSCCPPISQKLRSMLTKCSLVHEKLMKKAMMGQGFDRHLFALRTMAEKCSGSSPIPHIFQDPAYEIINHNILSSSRLSSPYVQAGTFGPCNKDGYGIGYTLLDDSFNIFVTSFRGHAYGNDLVNCFRCACEQIINITKKEK